MNVVLDASAALELIFKRDKAEPIKQILLNASKVISTDLYKAETANALWKYVKAGYISTETAGDLLDLSLDLVDEFVDISANNKEALFEADRLNHSVYDLLYLTLARRTGSKLISLDKKLNHLCNREGLSHFTK